MATFKVYKLRFTTPVHFGGSRGDYSVSLQTLQSDTMYAALTSCLAKLGCGIPEGGDLGFTISSLFPYYQKQLDDAPVYFLPKPMKSNLVGAVNIEHRKAIKKVCWIDIEHFEALAKAGGSLGETEMMASIHGRYMTSRHIEPDFIVSQVQERVSKPRTGTEDAKPYYVDRVSFAGHSGLYFIAEGDTRLLDKAIALLQHEGIGTDRNVGNGMFEYSTDEITISLPTDANAQMALSMYIPASEDELAAMLASDDVAYDFARRGGWITTPPRITMRKNFTHAFLPASVFAPHNPSEAKGVIVNLGEGVPELNHAIYRCGKSLFIPVNV